MKFGKYFLSNQKEELSSQYVQYNTLKALLKESMNAEGELLQKLDEKFMVTKF